MRVRIILVVVALVIGLTAGTGCAAPEPTAVRAAGATAGSSEAARPTVPGPTDVVTSSDRPATTPVSTTPARPAAGGA